MVFVENWGSTAALCSVGFSLRLFAQVLTQCRQNKTHVLKKECLMLIKV